MHKLKTILSVLLVAVIAVTLVACGGNNAATGTSQSSAGAAASSSTDAQSSAPAQKDYSEHMKISIALNTTNIDVNSDPFAQTWDKKFNMEWEIVAMTEDKAAEMTRVWINSGDMPDVVNWQYLHSEAMSYVKQGLIHKLPDDWKTRWPNIAKTYKDSGVGDKFDEMFGGTYVLPKPIYSSNKPVDTLINHWGIWYRADWFKAVGAEAKDRYTTRELMDIAKKIKEQDPGKVGGSLVPIDVPTSLLPYIFVEPNSTYTQDISQFYADKDGVFHWGPADPETLEGLKLWREAYDAGILHHEFYTLPTGRENEADLNTAGKAAVNVAAGMATVGSRQATFMRANLNVDPNEALNFAFILDKSSTYRANEIVNFYGTVLLSPKLNDAKLGRILDILDYSATDEAQYLIRMGFENEDWKKDANGQIVSLLPPDQQVTQKYISVQPLYTGMLVLPDNFQLVNPVLPQIWRDKARNQYVEKTKIADPTSSHLDLDVYFYTSPVMSRAILNLPEEYASIVLKGKDVEANWKSWVNEKMSLVQPALDELTKMKKEKK